MSFADTVLISAYRTDLSEIANRRRQASLRDNLHRRFNGNAIFETLGRYTNQDGKQVTEHLFVVDIPDRIHLNHDLKFLRQQLLAYNQDFMVYTNRSGVASFIGADESAWTPGATGVWVRATADDTQWTTCRWGDQWTIREVKDTVNNC